MPDGDKIHENLEGRWQDPYKQLCEWAYGEEAAAEAIAERVKKDLNRYGQAPQELVRDLAQILGDGANSVLMVIMEAAEYAEVRTYADDLIRQTKAHPVSLDAAQQAFEQQLQEIRDGHFSGNQDELLHAMFEKYGTNICNSNFIERVPLKSEHYGGVDQATITNRLDLAAPHLKRHISSFARQMARKPGNVSTLRMAPRSRGRQVDETFKISLPA
jgi:hypothetical protein